MSSFGFQQRVVRGGVCRDKWQRTQRMDDFGFTRVCPAT